MRCVHNQFTSLTVAVAGPGPSPPRLALPPPPAVSPSYPGTTPLHAAGFSSVLLAMQYLVVYGASLVAEDFEGRTPAQFAALVNKPALAAWLNAVAGWSQLRVAAGCRLHKDAAFLLRRGKIDPEIGRASGRERVCEHV